VPRRQSSPPSRGGKRKEAFLVILVRRHRRAVGAAVRRAVDDEVPGAVEEETGPSAVRHVPPGLLDVLLVHALGALGIVVVVRDVVRARSWAMMSQMRFTSPNISANAPITKTNTRPPLVAIGPAELDLWPLSSSIPAARLR